MISCRILWYLIRNLFERQFRLLRTTVADTLAHATKGYVSVMEHPLMDTFAEKAVISSVASRANCQ